MKNETFGWAILELMGHRRLGGYIQEQEIGGAPFIRIDIPSQDGNGATQFYSPAAVYCITPTAEETARRLAAIAVPAPVSRWELPAVTNRNEDEDEEELE